MTVSARRAPKSAQNGTTVQDVRQRTCRRLAEELETLGEHLWVSSWLRRDSGDEATALVVQTAGALARSSVILLGRRQYYAAGSLMRQLIEVEYLLFEFGRDAATRDEWLREPAETRPRKFSPKALRKRANGAFSAKQYGTHCRMGGHPNPEARGLLPEHSAPYDVRVMLWEDLGGHLVGVWRQLLPLLPGNALTETQAKRLRARISRLAKTKNATVPLRLILAGV